MRSPIAAFCLLFVTFSIFAQAPPMAKQVHTEHAYPGGTLVDDYAWLRERKSPEVHAYLEAENAYAEAAFAPLKPFAEKLYQETLSHVTQTDDSVPYLRNGYWYYSKTFEGKQYLAYYRRKGSMEAPEELLLDVNQLATGEKFMNVRGMAVSDDNHLLAYGVDNVGFRQYHLHIKNLSTGQVLPDTAERVDSMVWAADNKTLFYITEDEQTKRPQTLHKHTLGASADSVVYEEKDERFFVDVDRTRDRKYLMVCAQSHITTECRYLAAGDPAGAWKIIEPRKDNVLYSVDEAGDAFYLRINDTSKNYRVVTAPVATLSKANWKEFLAAQESVPMEDFNIFAGFYEVSERVDGLEVLRVVDRTNHQSKAISFPDKGYSAAVFMNPEYDTKALRYTYQSPITPSSTYDYDVAAGASKLLKQVKVPNFDRSQYAVDRILAKAADGTLVPVTVAYRKDKFTPGKNPLFVYAYGSYGYSMEDTFQVLNLPLLDRGVVTSVAHIRGGGEMGDAWHDGGKMMHKRNTFSDFIDATEGLLKAGYGEPGRVGIEGASAGGLLMGAVTNLRPDLFKVVLCEVPFVDVMNTMLDATLPLTVSEYEEWGNPNQAAAFQYMRTYSPYDNVEKKAYPAILVQTSFDDSQVMYWEPSKYTAKLRAMKTDSNPLLFFVNMHGGHGGSSGRYDNMRLRDRNYAFMLSQLGITE